VNFAKTADGRAPFGKTGRTQAQLDSVTRRLADLTEMVLRSTVKWPRWLEIIRLSHKKSELLSHRLDTVIAALKKGRMI
jgi:hypothetical protein